MIEVSRLSSGSALVLNADLIETIEATPDTVITLTNGHKILVRESPQEITRRVVAFRRSIEHAPPAGNRQEAEPE